LVVNVLAMFVKAREDCFNLAIRVVKVGDLVLLNSRGVDVSVTNPWHRARRKRVEGAARLGFLIHVVSLVIVSLVVTTNKTMLVVGVNG
jgi:hypothetical protein